MKKIILIFITLALCNSLYSQKRKHKTENKRKNKIERVVKTKKQKVNTASISIKGLERQRANIKKQIQRQEKALNENKANVQKRLQKLMLINAEIGQRQKTISSIEQDISHINGNISLLHSQLKTLKQQLSERKNKYVKSMRYMAKHRRVQDNLMFVFSAKNLVQMYRRLRFVREYAAYQRAQGEMVKAKQKQVDDKHKQLQKVKGQKNNLLYKGKKEKVVLQNKQNEQQQVVNGLQRQQKTIISIIEQQKRKDAALNAQIDRLVAIEVEKARQRAAAEARKKALAAEAAKRRKEELARRKAAAEAAKKENERRIALAKQKEQEAARMAEQARVEAQKAAEQAEKENKRKAEKLAQKAREKQIMAEQKAKEAEAQRMAAERKAKTEKERNEKQIAQATKEVEDVQKLSTIDRMMSGGFEANRGRLPMPITGAYKVVSHYGQYNVEGLKGVRLDNKGINILGHAGCMARSIYDGEVSAVFGYSGSMVVMVRHGAYISVYCNLKSVSVSKGQRVSTRQALGVVGNDNILQFQLRRETAKLNPEAWLGR